MPYSSLASLSLGPDPTTEELLQLSIRGENKAWAKAVSWERRIPRDICAPKLGHEHA